MNKISENKISDSENKSDSEKKRRNRPCKNERYESERKELIKELENLMGLTDERRGVLLYDLEHNEVLKEYLKSKVGEIKRMYKCSSWNYFKSDENKKDLVGLLKSIFKSEKYEIISKKKIDIRGDVKKQYCNLYFLNGVNINQYLQ